ncbi:MAG: DUF4142 domain-containing protein [Sphingomonas sp.]
MRVARLLPLIALTAGAFQAQAMAATPQDRQFLTDAIKGDNSEVTLGTLARAHGASAGVRSFGAALVTDHSKAKVQASAVARQSGVQVPDGMMAEAREEQTKLQRLHGKAFDDEFARYMVNDHKKDIAKFEKEAKQGSGAVASLARQQLPVLRKHLTMAEKLQHH